MTKYIVRNLCKDDYDSNYLQLLCQYFSINVDVISFADFTDYIDKLQSTHQIVIIENINDNIPSKNNNTPYIIGSSAIFIETKIIHNFGKVAHIEDVIVHNEFRGKGIGKMLIEKCIEVAKQNGCYKIILDCSEHNCEFYEKCGFTQKGAQMAMYF